MYILYISEITKVIWICQVCVRFMRSFANMYTLLSQINKSFNLGNHHQSHLPLAISKRLFWGSFCNLWMFYILTVVTSRGQGGGISHRGQSLWAAIFFLLHFSNTHLSHFHCKLSAHCEPRSLSQWMKQCIWWLITLQPSHVPMGRKPTLNNKNLGNLRGGMPSL